jgi:hypothetical protein
MSDEHPSGIGITGEIPPITVRAAIKLSGKKGHARCSCAIAIGFKRKRANLSEAHLEAAGLMGAHLEAANLTKADLRGAFLMQARLEGAVLTLARLEIATLMGAHLEGAALGATLVEADLVKAHLEGADLAGAAGLADYQLLDDFGDGGTHLPSGITRPKHWPESALVSFESLHWLSEFHPRRLWPAITRPPPA